MAEQIKDKKKLNEIYKQLDQESNKDIEQFDKLEVEIKDLFKKYDVFGSAILCKQGTRRVINCMDTTYTSIETKKNMIILNPSNDKNAERKISNSFNSLLDLKEMIKVESDTVDDLLETFGKAFDIKLK